VAKNAAEAADARAAGEQRLQSGDAKGSLAHFTRALRKAPQQSPDAAAALGLLYMARSAALLAVGESRAALSDAMEALLLAPLYPKAWRRYAAAHPHPSDTVRNVALRLCGDDDDDEDALAAEDEALRVVAQLRDTSAAEEDGASASVPAESTALVKESRAGVDGPGRYLVTTSTVSSTGKLLLTD
jgi:tetratricopeptide (TPR) repeat protein